MIGEELEQGRGDGGVCRAGPLMFFFGLVLCVGLCRGFWAVGSFAGVGFDWAVG